MIHHAAGISAVPASANFSLRWSGGPPQGWHAISAAIDHLEGLREELLPQWEADVFEVREVG